MKKWMLILSGSLIALGTLFVLLDRPNLWIENKGANVIAHVETLGEYPTTILHFQIKDVSSGIIVFELIKDKGTPQIHTFSLSVGENSVIFADPQYGSYRVIVPAGGNKFILSPGINYRILVWGNGWLPIHANFKFG
jgi:hypothetical protein